MSKNFIYKSIVCVFILGITHLTAFTQCNKSIEEYNSYFKKNIINLDPIEGVWKVSRTTRMYLNGNIRHIQRFNESETWIITKNGGTFIVCYPETHNLDYSFECYSKDSKNYLFKKNYLTLKTYTFSSALLSNKTVNFTIQESEAYLKEILKEKFQSGVSITHDYQLVKVEDYFDKVTNQIPQVKNWFLNSIKSYLEEVFK